MRPRLLSPACALLLLCPGAAAARPHVAEFGMALDAPAAVRAASADARSVTRVLRPGRRFDLVGLRWRGRGELVDAQLRTRARGRWRSWAPLPSADDHGPDRQAATRGSDPVWVGGAEAVQLRWRRAPARRALRFVRVTNRVRLAPAARAAQAGGPPPMVSRSEWDPGGQCRPRAEPDYGRVDMAFVHHTVSENDYAPEATPAMVLAICRYHRNANGWNDIGYNFLVDKYGRLFEGRAGGIDRAVVGAQAQGFNSQSTSVSNIGDFSAVPESQAALDAMASLLAWKLGVHGVPVTGSVTLTSGGGSENRYPAGRPVAFERISGHRDGGRTACPGDALYAQLPALRDRTAARAAGAAPPPAAEPPAGSVSLQALSTTLQYPEPARLTGTLSGEGEVWVQVAAGAAYRTLVKARPDAGGTWTAEVPLSRGHTFRALQVLPDGRHGAASPVLPIALRPSLTAGGPRRVLAGTAIPVLGTIAPRQARISASLSIVDGRGRARFVRRVARGTRPSGAYSLRLRVRRPALYRVRVSFAGTRFAAAAAAADLYVRAVRHRRSLSGGQAAPAG